MMNNHADDYNITVITNMAVAPFLGRTIESKFAMLSKNVRILQINIESVFSGEERTLHDINAADCFVLWLHFDYQYVNYNIKLLEGAVTADDLTADILHTYRMLFDYLRKYSQSPIYAITFDRNCSFAQKYLGSVVSKQHIIDRINCDVYDEFCESFIFVDINLIIAEMGTETAYSMKNESRWQNPYSITLNATIGDEIYRQYLVSRGITKKCIVVDCDNVLWGGILSENNANDIIINRGASGIFYYYFQKLLVELYYHGVILAVCSKNDMEDVLRVFREHPQMLLKEKHISYFSVNWEDKVKNIINIADKLNIGLDSMLFIDDSPAEIEGVKYCLPAVETILFEKEKILHSIKAFNIRNQFDLQEILARQKTYKTNELRTKLREKTHSYAEYLEMLKTEVKIEKASEMHLHRVSELSLRTNKCTNGKRYTADELKTLAKNRNILIYYVSVVDRFSDLGISGAFIVNGDTVELFCLSCRVLGREIEAQIIEYMKSHFDVKNICFADTGKNDGIKAKFGEAAFVVKSAE